MVRIEYVKKDLFLSIYYYYLINLLLCTFLLCLIGKAKTTQNWELFLINSCLNKKIRDNFAGRFLSARHFRDREKLASEEM